jgi:ElaB/YqjD/DUF883 family membrane-anchored ribosome-binding protein
MSENNGTANVEDLGKIASENLHEARRQAIKRAEDAKREAVKQLHNVAGTIRKQVREKETSEEIVANADHIADGLEKAANYLSSHSVEQMGSEATKAVRDNPWQSITIVFIIGLLVGLFLRRD